MNVTKNELKSKFGNLTFSLTLQWPHIPLNQTRECLTWQYSLLRLYEITWIKHSAIFLFECHLMLDEASYSDFRCMIKFYAFTCRILMNSEAYWRKCMINKVVMDHGFTAQYMTLLKTTIWLGLASFAQVPRHRTSIFCLWLPTD